jgi:hypothetical protein
MAKRDPSAEPTQPRLPAVKPASEPRSGRVRFDERGQAIWEWAVRTGMFDRNASTQRIRALTDGPVKLELEQTLSLKRAPAARGPAATSPAAKPLAGGPQKPQASSNPYQRAATPGKRAESQGSDPYSRGPARSPETMTFNPYDRSPKGKR